MRQKMELVEIEYLIDRIDEDTWSSSLTKRHLEHEDFQRILQAGETVIPHLVRRLRRAGGWTPILLLTKILKKSPVKPEHSGKYDLIMQDWLEWADNHGY
jgi:hypothetical protein